ncbi:glycogen/starch/alpha-glucan phosphorylase [Fusobacterium russii]|uniref:glycogen/starch/alpha-glucan phosphorylase n=1 Tax=Fusobacterium russii TaxID=854 RepID=UPI0003A13D20|nr:glycogen/starch/alpha-glucan phosphorylase [Fusobacterium russii]
MSNFTESIKKYLETTFGNSIEEANERQLYQTLMVVTRDRLSALRYEYNKKLKQTDQKQAYYMSMEFLVGRTLRNNLFNLGLEEEVKDLLYEKGMDIDRIYNMEPDPGLGNGGLGRLASCYMDAWTSQDYPVTGFSILYEFGIFKQVIQNGWQQEYPDNWLEYGSYGLVYRKDEGMEIKFYGRTSETWTKTGLKINYHDYTSIIAEPYDLMISGYKTESVNVLRLWKAKANSAFNMKLFERGEYAKSMEADAIATSISKLLYPADDNDNGKALRIKQQYFFTSASLQQIVKAHFKTHGTLDNFAEKVVIHINDTHPAMCIPELMRILMDEYSYSWEEAWDITTKTFAYTNHTIMAEALEKWSVNLFEPILPRIYTIIKEINNRFCKYCYENGAAGDIETMAIIHHGMIRMANLCIVSSYNVNGVSKLHSDILIEDTFKDFNKIYPGKFNNVTNGIAHRRWIGQANPELTKYLTDLLGVNFLKDLSAIENLMKFKDDKSVIENLNRIKDIKKTQLARYIKNSTGINIDNTSIFDIQVKRLHEYKRQLLNALHIIYLFREIKFNALRPQPRTFIFGAKASSGYVMAKNIIKLICSLSDMIEADPLVRNYIKVIFIEDYRVTLAEIIIPAANISEQISQAGKEASGTGNMKFMLNGALTLGTMDGANVEIHGAVGDNNIFIFGLTTPEVNELFAKGYKPYDYYISNPEIKNTLDFMRTIDGNGTNFNNIVDYLINHDPYMCLADFKSYIDKQKEVAEIYQDKDRWGQMSLVNIAKSGIFSADRSTAEYVNNIWNIEKVK